MSPDWSLTDRTTWITILTLIAAALSDVFHRSFAGYVPAAATIAAGLVIAGVAIAKHHYAAAVTTAATAVTTAAGEMPAPAQPTVAQLAAVLSQAGALLSAPQSPPPAFAPPTPVPAAPTAPGGV